jgi:membrane-bound lytic murein transglycosylase B
MRLKRVQVPARNNAGRAARRDRWWRFVSVSAAVAFVLGGVAAHEADAADGEPTVAFAAQSAVAQPAGSTPRPLAAPGTGVVAPADEPYMTPKMLAAVPAGPGPVSKPVRTVLTSTGMTTALDADGIPAVAQQADQHAATVLAARDPACRLPWQLLTAIGRVESDNGQFGGAMLLANGNTTIPIYGIPLDGRPGVALVRATSYSTMLDADPNFQRAVGPMQFLPSTWALYGADGNGDGKKDPNNIFDAALGAAGYLCAGGGDMANPAQEAAAVLRYNDADEYVHVVLALAASYEHGDAATVPATAPAGAGGNGGESTPGTPGPPSSPAAEAPSPAKTPTRHASQAPTRTPAAQPAPSSSQATPTATAPAGATATASSAQPSQAPVPSASPTSQAGQAADIGWAPAMRQAVVSLLTAQPAVPAQPTASTHPAPQPSQTSAARKPTASDQG